MKYILIHSPQFCKLEDIHEEWDNLKSENKLPTDCCGSTLSKNGQVTITKLWAITEQHLIRVRAAEHSHQDGPAAQTTTTANVSLSINVKMPHNRTMHSAGHNSRSGTHSGGSLCPWLGQLMILCNVFDHLKKVLNSNKSVEIALFFVRSPKFKKINKWKLRCWQVSRSWPRSFLQRQLLPAPLNWV